MSRVNQSRTTRWVMIAFVAGAVAGFTWALLRPHPVSSYRDELENQRGRT